MKSSDVTAIIQMARSMTTLAKRVSYMAVSSITPGGCRLGRIVARD
jgi:hypothetical protein